MLIDDYIVKESKKNNKRPSQRFFASLVEIPPQTINNLLTKNKIPNPDNIKKIFLKTKGKIDPNIVYGVQRWKEELKQLKEPK